MFNKERELLQKSLPRLPVVVCQGSLRHDIDELVRSIFPTGKLAVIDDNRTGEAFGNLVFKALKNRFSAEHICLPGFPEADSETVELIRRKSVSCDALVAVGSGTINDLCKYTAFLDKKPYIVFPTAASMNGYLSANASITAYNYKKSMKAHAPEGVFCDLSVIAAAPARLNKSGLGDSLARPTAQADWLLSHLLLATPYNETPFALLKPYEDELFDNARGIAKSDPASIELLIRSLLLSGLGMTIAGGSTPASQSEHMVAHAYEMLEIQGVRNAEILPPLHGEQIGVTTLLMSQMQEKLLRGYPALRPMEFPYDDIVGHFGIKTADEAKETYEGKKRHCERSEAIQKNKMDCHVAGAPRNDEWENIATQIEKIMIPSAKIQSILITAETPYKIEALGWDDTTYNTALTYARFLRNRFTFLDLA